MRKYFLALAIFLLPAFANAWEQTAIEPENMKIIVELAQKFPCNKTKLSCVDKDIAIDPFTGATRNLAESPYNFKIEYKELNLKKGKLILVELLDIKNAWTNFFLDLDNKYYALPAVINIDGIDFKKPHLAVADGYNYSEFYWLDLKHKNIKLIKSFKTGDYAAESGNYEDAMKWSFKQI